ncbi:MAG: exodeoxyribonuclease VII small subunit [Alphaproteobacteria bacterium]|nr:exodeoxyribonuclease VII small subunit [Alphaproteobacteria bacterium]NCB50026.1 exodeoxyribonuclease VII small subunit [Alphaproteobacteria bacterium]
MENKKLSFEEALKELEEIVQRLEKGQVKLEESVTFYERGMFLKTFCLEKIKEAKSKIDLLKLDADGNVIGKENFDGQSH